MSSLGGRPHCRGAQDPSPPSELSEACLRLTLERRVLDLLLDFGQLHHVSCSLSEEELPGPRLEAFPVVFNDRDAVLQGGYRHYEGGVTSWGAGQSTALLATQTPAPAPSIHMPRPRLSQVPPKRVLPAPWLPAR